jgi:hypothetical protein
MNILAHLDNPIAQRELAYQQYHAERRAKLRLHWAYRLVYYPALAMALLVFWSEFGAALQPSDGPSVALVLHVVVIFTFVVALLMQLYLLLQTLLRAATSIAREKQSGTWEDLLMTGSSAHRLVLGKWWATLRGLLGGYLLLIPLRAGVAVWLSAVFDRTQALGIDSVRDVAAPSALAFLATFPIVTLFTVGAAVLVAAIGMLASALSRKLVEALALAFAFTALVFGGMFGLLATTHYVAAENTLIPLEWHSVVDPLSENVLLSWMDNGLTLTSELVTYQPEYSSISRQYIASNDAAQKMVARALAFVTSALLFAALTWAVLRLAQIAVVRQGALPDKQRQKYS